ncbi:MAG: hypothetical protein M3Y70_07890 [Pseudomonadota bacterium]|nr:hypothetical protein [Pseudomonadota bacterium]
MNDLDDAGLGPRSPQLYSWAEVHATTGGLKDVGIDQILKGRIDSKYDLPVEGKCGLLGCERVHGLGYIFAIPGGGYVNVGHCCADRHAKDQKDALDSMKRDFSDWTNEQSRKISLELLVEDAQEKIRWLAEVEPVAVRGTALRNSFLREFRGQVEIDILQRAQKKLPRVERQVSVSASTRDAQRAMIQGGRVDVVAENIRVAKFEVSHIGDLRGLDIFVPQRDPVSLWIRFQTSVNVVLGAENGDLDAEDLRILNRIRREFGAQFNDLSASMRAADDFFSQKNLDVVRDMPINRGKGISRIVVSGNEIRVLREQ